MVALEAAPGYSEVRGEVMKLVVGLIADHVSPPPFQVPPLGWIYEDRHGGSRQAQRSSAAVRGSVALGLGVAVGLADFVGVATVTCCAPV